ncbi:MAG: trigger factor [Patescibacteria group bacterium]|nr:trigger factor [Patescibacteria group bacterium]
MSKNQAKKDSYVVKVENLPNSEVKIVFKIPTDKFELFLDEAANELSKEMKVDGFRPGKTPRSVIEQTVGAEKLLYEGAEKAIRKVYVDALLDNKIEAVGEPKVDITKIAKGNDFEFTAIVGILPEVKLNGWEKDVKKVNEEFRGVEVKVDDKEVDREVSFLANQRAKVITVNRSAKDKDQVEVNFEVLKDNVPIENGTAKKQQIVIGEGRFIPGFEENIIGMKAGEGKEFSLKFPKEYHAKHLADQEAVFKTKVNLVQERQAPKIDDEFAKGIGKFKTLDELKKNIKEGITYEQKHKAEDAQKNKIIDAIVEKAQFDVPGVLVDREIETMSAELEQDLKRIGLTREKYYEQMKTTEEKIKKQWRKKDAVKRVKAALILRQLAKGNKISPDTKEVEERVNQTMQYYKTLGDVKDKVDVARLYEATKGSLTNEKVFEFLMKK